MALQAPKGTTDLLPKQARIWDHFKRCASAVFSRYGYEPIEMPIFEQTELFVRGIGEATDVVSKEMVRHDHGRKPQDPAWRRSCEEQ